MGCCIGLCAKQKFIKKYNIVKSVSQQYRRAELEGFKMPDNWHWCALCYRFYQGPKNCFCCGNITRTTARHKKTQEQQKAYRRNMIESSIKFKANRPHGVRNDILNNLTKWEDLLRIKRPVMNPLDYQ